MMRIRVTGNFIPHVGKPVPKFPELIIGNAPNERMKVRCAPLLELKFPDETRG